jgi:hypothetical protein
MGWAIRVQTLQGEPIVSPTFDDRDDAEVDIDQLRWWLEGGQLSVGWLAVTRDNVVSANLIEVD